MSEHSKLPWEATFGDYGHAYGRSYIVVGDGFNSIASVWTRCVSGRDLPYEANASLIVRSVNSHQKLVEALEAVISATQAYLPPDGISAKECISRILSATDNPTINAILSEAKSK